MRVANAVRIRRTLFAAISSNLTRRAKHLHIEIIGKSYGPAREIAAGFLFGRMPPGWAGAGLGYVSAQAKEIANTAATARWTKK